MDFHTIKIYGRIACPVKHHTVSRYTLDGPLNLSRQRSGTALKLLWQLLANMLFSGTYVWILAADEIHLRFRRPGIQLNAVTYKG